MRSKILSEPHNVIRILFRYLPASQEADQLLTELIITTKLNIFHYKFVQQLTSPDSECVRVVII
jgi:hypothetical protein